ncbi:hypothetical protein AAY473_013770, partial [Plecturocebus cupreus]
MDPSRSMSRYCCLEVLIVDVGSTLKGLFWIETKELRDLFLLLFFCCFKVISFHKDECTCLHPLYGRKEFLEREDKDSLGCKRSPRLKTGELHVQLAREPETVNILSGKLDAESLSGADEDSIPKVKPNDRHVVLGFRGGPQWHALTSVLGFGFTPETPWMLSPPDLPPVDARARCFHLFCRLRLLPLCLSSHLLWTAVLRSRAPWAWIARQGPS